MSIIVPNISPEKSCEKRGCIAVIYLNLPLMFDCILGDLPVSTARDKCE